MYEVTPFLFKSRFLSEILDIHKFSFLLSVIESFFPGMRVVRASYRNDEVSTLAALELNEFSADSRRLVTIHCKMPHSSVLTKYERTQTRTRAHNSYSTQRHVTVAVPVIAIRHFNSRSIDKDT